MFIVLVVLSLASLAAGKKASFLHDWGTTAVTVTAFPFLKTINAIEGAFSFTKDLIVSYHSARVEADELGRRLAEARKETLALEEAARENVRLREMLNFVRSEPGLYLDPVKILENFKGIVMIDRGSSHGIRESMCAVTAEGVVGVVTQVDALTSNIVTLHHADCKVGAMFPRSRVRGIVHGRSSDVSRYCTIHYIDMKDDIRVGEHVVTSPESIFPSGYPIGRVVRVEEGSGVWKIAYLEPAVDVYRLDEVFVLRQAVTPVEELAGREVPLLEPGSVAPPVPDTRTLQDRYAP